MMAERRSNFGGRKKLASGSKKGFDTDTTNKPLTVNTNGTAKETTADNKASNSAASMYYSFTHENDMFDILHHSDWAKEPFRSRIPYPEVNELVGWAMHISQPEAAHLHGDVPINPLLGLPSAPPPPSYLNELLTICMKLIRRDKKYAIVMNTMDHSAAVTAACLLEEMMTTILMPLAKKHVVRCRKLDMEAVSKERGEEGIAMDDWTLPPEEALLKIIDETPDAANNMAFPTALLPTFCNNNHKGSELEGTHKSFENWCSAHTVSTAFVKKNMHMFKYVLSDDPTSYATMMGLDLGLAKREIRDNNQSNDASDETDRSSTNDEVVGKVSSSDNNRVKSELMNTSTKTAKRKRQNDPTVLTQTLKDATLEPVQKYDSESEISSVKSNKSLNDTANEGHAKVNSDSKSSIESTSNDSKIPIYEI